MINMIREKMSNKIINSKMIIKRSFFFISDTSFLIKEVDSFYFIILNGKHKINYKVTKLFFDTNQEK